MKNALHFAELTTAMEKVHRAGVPGVFAEVRDGDQVNPPCVHEIRTTQKTHYQAATSVGCLFTAIFNATEKLRSHSARR